MLENINNEETTKSKIQYPKLWKALAVLSLFWILSSCSPKDKAKIWANREQHYKESAAFFWWMREEQAKIYKEVARQENRQQDFKDAWVNNPILDQEIERSHDWAEKQNSEVEESTRKKSRAQDKASKARAKASWYAEKAKASTNKAFIPTDQRLDEKELDWVIAEENHN